MAASYAVESVEFITCDEEGKFLITPKGAEVLKAVNTDIAVIALAGLQRTGKSFLMNLLSRNDIGDVAERNFVVGNTVNTCTKGINMYIRPPKSGSPTIIFMDTEGFGSTIRSQSYDIKLFSLALLLSSQFVYNSRGVIDGNAIEDLSLVVELTKHIHVMSQSGSDSGRKFGNYFPHFLWILRDFTLKLQSDGKTMSSKEYLENALKQDDDAIDEASLRQDGVRAMIKAFFPQRDCVTLIRPILEESKLQNLIDQPFVSLRQAFQDGVVSLRKRLFEDDVVLKKMSGVKLKGAHLLTLAETYVRSLNEGSTPTISTAWTRVVEAQCEEAADKAVAQYEKEMAAGLAKCVKAASADYDVDTTPVESADLLQLHTESLASARKLFDSLAMDAEDMAPFAEKLQKQANLKLERMRERNTELSRTFCGALLTKLSLPKFAVAEGDDGEAEASIDGTAVTQLCTSFAHDVGALSREYHKLSLGPCKWEVAAQYFGEQTPEYLKASCRPIVARLDARLLELQKQVRVTKDELHQTQETGAAALKSHKLEIERYKQQAEQNAEQTKTQRAQLQTIIDSQKEELARMWEKSKRDTKALSTAQVTIDELRTKALDDHTSFQEELNAEKNKAAANTQKMNNSIMDMQREHSSEKDALLRQQLKLQQEVSELQRDMKHQATESAAQLRDVEAKLQQDIRRERTRADDLQKKIKAEADQAKADEKMHQELEDLRNDKKLLKDNLQMTKNLVDAKIAERVELEYQLAAKKADFAQAESERIMYEQDVVVLEDLVSKLKAKFLGSRSAIRSVGLNKTQLRRLNEL